MEEILATVAHKKANHDQVNSKDTGKDYRKHLLNLIHYCQVERKEILTKYKIMPEQ